MAESRSLVKLCGVAGIALLALTSGALADGYEGSIKDAPATPEREFTYSFGATGTSDYVFRGISQSENDPAIQGTINIGYGIFYAGIWASSIDLASGSETADVEVDYYAGIKPTWGPATFDFGVIYYAYPGYLDGDGDALELKAGVSGEIYKGLSAGGAVYYSPDYNNLEYWVFEGTLAYTLPTVSVFTPTVSGTVGTYDFDTGGADYTYWNAGLTLAVEKISLDFRYWDTDFDSGVCNGKTLSTCDERFVFSVGVALP